MRQAEREQPAPNKPSKPEDDKKDSPSPAGGRFDQDTGEPIYQRYDEPARPEVGYTKPDKPSKYNDDDVIDVDAKPVKNKPLALPKKESINDVAGNGQRIAEGSAHGYNVVKWYEKNGDQLKLTRWLRKEAGLPKDADVYFDDADLVYGDQTIVPGALVNPKLKFNDLLTAVVQATGGTAKQKVDGVYRSHGVEEGANEYEQRQKLIKYIAQKKGWDVSDLELAKTTELVLMYKKIKEQDVNEAYIQELSSDLLASYKKKAGEQATAADKAGDYEKGHKRFKGIVKATNKQFDNDAKKHK
jgi:hypothetical protein